MVAEPIAMLDRTADTSYDAHREASRTRPANPPPYDPMIPNHNAHNSGDLGTQRSQIHSRSSSPDSRNSRNHSRNRVSFVEPAHPTQSGGKKKTSYLPGFAGGSSKHGNTTTVTSDMIEKEDDGSNGPNREIYISRMFFRCVSLVLSFVLIGLLAHVLSVHAGSKDRTAINKGTGLEFRLWPKDLNLKPTHILLTAGSLCAFLSIGILIASFNAKIRRLTQVGNYTTLVISVMLTLAFGIATAYFELWDSDKHNWYDLWSWSCVKGNSRSGTYQDQLDFHGLCRKMRGVWYLALAITGVELGAVVCCIWAVVVSGKSYWKVASGQEEDRERRGERWYGE